MKLSDDLIALADKTDMLRAVVHKKERSTIKIRTCQRAHVVSSVQPFSCLFRGLHPHRSGTCEF